MALPPLRFVSHEELNNILRFPQSDKLTLDIADLRDLAQGCKNAQNLPVLYHLFRLLNMYIWCSEEDNDGDYGRCCQWARVAGIVANRSDVITANTFTPGCQLYIGASTVVEITEFLQRDNQTTTRYELLEPKCWESFWL